ncbi:hypothetical protein NONI108955_36150 [Nocardia ninae]|uniref:Uncharacterized protein n=1 Tax=Nocardia ninae NBRC 108245 TaxID=1210091 RepID=A0A511MNI7_9NOCA|nr:hypothetical protein [Nocardia ninae]GEM41526.1 hypothetical protein NN4_60450 [Nocardia ninae NBRC 108245]
MSASQMVQAQNYWVSGDPSCRVSFQIFGTRVNGYGSTAVRYVPEGEYEGLVWLTLGGHHTGGLMPLLIMSVDAAAELSELLAAAVIDGRIAQGVALQPIPHRDITCESCQCPDCDDELVALLEAEADAAGGQ